MVSGGKRKGAGRKPAPSSKKPYGTKLAQQVIDYLRSRENAATTIEQAITTSPGFKSWAKDRSTTGE